jgi:3-oxoacyl-[acyl-carrier-protein] synthase II
MNKDRRVVVTGMGLRSPIGNSLTDFSQSLKQSRSGVVRMDEWDQIDHLHTKVAGVCKGIDEKVIPRSARRGMGRVAILAALASQDAITDSNLSEEQISSPECGISFGSTAGSSHSLEAHLRKILANQSLKGVQSSTYLHFMSHTCAANLAMYFSIKGPVIASCTACVSGSQGIGFAYQNIKDGRAQRMLAGGAEEMHFMDAGVFDVMHATSTKFNHLPTSTPRPFDVDRDGLVVGEGAGAMILEEREQALARGATIHAEIIAFGNNCDGSHLTRPTSKGMIRVIKVALEEARLSAKDIDVVLAHATATPYGDQIEAKATYHVFSDSVPVTALKGYMGHTLGACGALESIATVLMLQEGCVPPILNLDSPDPKCAPLQYVRKEPRNQEMSIGMNNNFAFGGINTSLIFRR